MFSIHTPWSRIIRTGAEVGNVNAVMDGDLDYFINEKLKQKE